MYLARFVLPINKERKMIADRKEYNGGEKFGYIDNVYPCGLFSSKGLREVNFDKVTIFYGGNGSGKSTLLNLIACKLELNRIAPFNSSELLCILVPVSMKGDMMTRALCTGYPMAAGLSPAMMCLIIC